MARRWLRKLMTTKGLIQIIFKKDAVVECPEGKSLISGNDLEELIDQYFQNSSSYEYTHITDYFNDAALKIRDRFEMELNEFLAWFADRPNHLEHVLDDIAQKRLITTSNIQEIVKVLKEYPNLQESFLRRSTKMSLEMKKLNNFMEMCKLDCSNTGTKLLKKRSKRHIGYYCVSLKDLSSIIQQTIPNVTEQYIIEFHNTIQSQSASYCKKIDDLKLQLKDYAFNKYGKTMYDLLELQDFYHDFLENLNKIISKSGTFTFKQMFEAIDSKLAKLDQSINTFGETCNNCSDTELKPQLNRANDFLILKFKSVDVRNNHRSDDNSDHEDANETENDETIRHIEHKIVEKISNVINPIRIDIENTLTKLNETIASINVNGYLITNLENVQGHVSEMIAKERQFMKELTELVSPSSIIELLGLYNNTEQLLKNIDRELEHLAKNY